MYLPVLPLDPLPALSSTPKAKCNVQQVGQSADFMPSDRTTASSIKVLAGEFDALSGPTLTLHSDITGAKKKKFIPILALLYCCDLKIIAL